MISNLHLLLDTAAPAVSPAVEGAIEGTEMGLIAMLPNILMMVAMVGVFYFLLIRPQKKKEKAVKNMLSSLKAGDRVCTIGGIYGTVTAIKDDTVTIAVGTQKSLMVVARWGIRSVEDAPLENDAEPMI